MKRLLIVAMSMAVVSAAPSSTDKPVTLTALGTVKTGPMRGEDPRIAEINAYDFAGRRIYVVNPLDGRLDVIDASDPARPTAAGSVNIVADCQAALAEACPVLQGSEPNSVAVSGHLLGIAVANAVRTNNGHAVFYKLQESGTPQFLSALEVGALPDMITFSPDGRFALTANEGEPNSTYTIDPKGSVSIIDVRRLWSQDAVRMAGFEAFDSAAARQELVRDGVRIFGPNASVSQDLEPEYVAVHGTKAYVTLQENNALAIVNLATASVEKITSLGLKDHSALGNALDASDQDGINIRNWPISGMYQSDAIAAFTVGGKAYLVAANEGDAREYSAYAETLRLGNAGYVLDPTVFPDAAQLKANAALGRLNVTTASGDTDGDGDFDRIDVLGGRSLSIRDTQGRLVWDSGEMFERLSAQHDGTLTVFNTTNTANSRDNRSDDKGVEPESVVVGHVHGRPYAFVGLERDGGIVVLDLSDPTAPAFVTYVTNRKLPRNPTTGAFLPCNDTNDCGDLGPEGLTFVPAERSHTGTALLIVSNEVSSTTTIWKIE
jgi:2',3'-cyclic-nucleotide 2'-phosphodiesterase / 3'-nucleotidase / 5'-nucleotidase